MSKKTYLIRSAKDQGVYKKGEVIRTVELEENQDPTTLKTGLMYEVTICELGSMKPNRDLLPTRHTEQNRLKGRLEKLHSKAFDLLKRQHDNKSVSTHSVGLVLARKALFNHYFESYTS